MRGEKRHLAFSKTLSQVISSSFFPFPLVYSLRNVILTLNLPQVCAVKTPGSVASAERTPGTARGTQQYHTAQQLQPGVVGVAFKEHLFHPCIPVLKMKITRVTDSLVVQPPLGAGLDSLSVSQLALIPLTPAGSRWEGISLSQSSVHWSRPNTPLNAIKSSNN